MKTDRHFSPKPMLDERMVLDAFTQHSINPKHAKVLWRLIIRNGLTDVNEIATLPKKAKEILDRDFAICTSRVVSRKDSEDGSTTKLLIELQDGRQVESVIMRYGDVELRSFPEKEKQKRSSKENNNNVNVTNDDDTIQSNSNNKRFKSNRRATLCVSSQVGCSMGCKFCATGTMGLLENLVSGEIIEQLYHANKIEKIRGVVFMGMGEPLDNYENVHLAVQAMIDTSRFGLSPSRVSISTVGIVPRIKQLKRDMPFVSLALSLHAPDQELRTKIVPTAKSWNIERIMEAADAFVSNQNDQEYRKERRVKHNPNLDPDTIEDFTVAKRRKLLLEYVLLGPDVNCSKSVAHKMGELLTANEERLKNSILNVIPYNPTSAGDLQGYEPPSQQQIDEFLAIVRSYGAVVMIRQELGQDVNAACGQLVVDNSKYQVGDIEDMTNRKRSDKKPIATVTVKRSRVKQDVNRNSNTNSNTNSNKKEIILRLIWTLLAVLAVRKVLLPLLIHYL